jgi:hypothetical protein
MFYVLSCAAIAFSVLYHIFYIYGNNVVAVSRVVNDTTVNGTSMVVFEYNVVRTSFSRSITYKILAVFRTMFRDTILLLILSDKQFLYYLL